MTDYAAVLIALYPGAEWSLNGDSYEGLTWLSDSPKPSQAELDAAWPAVQSAQALTQAQAARAAAYRTESDPLFFKWQRGEGEQQAWLDAVAAIRDRHPYP
jgi:hypothetical protein